MSQVRVSCPKCGRAYDVPAAALGRSATCRGCHSRFAVRCSEEAAPATTADRVAEVWQPGDVLLELYEVRQVHHGGAMGHVYRVHHREWGIDLAVKSPRPKVLARRGGAERFRREAETWVRLGLHPHTVSCYYVRTLGGIPRVFAEYVEGGTLADWVQDGRLYQGGTTAALACIIDVAIQLAWGLAFAHARGLVHQDVKPANVLLTPAGIAKVSDFGLTGSVEDTPAGEPTAAGVAYKGGTPAYYSPEQAEAAAQVAAGVSPEKRRRLTAHTDVWSWAVCLLEMFTGAPPCRYGGQLAAEVLEGYLGGAAPDEPLPPMPAGIAALLRQCFQLDPADRPRDMNEAVDALRAVYQDVTGHAYARPAPQTADLPADSLCNRGVSLLDLGDRAAAVSHFEEALRAAPHHLEATYNLGLLRWRGGQITDSELLRQLQTAVASADPGDWVGDYLLGLVHVERGDAESAVRHLQNAFEKSPEGSPTKRALHLARSGLGKWRGLVREFVVPQEDYQGTSHVCLSADGRLALAADCWSMKLWDTATGRCLRTFEPPQLTGDRMIGAIALSPDGRTVLSGGWDKRLHLWDVKNGALVRTFTGHTDWVQSGCFSGDGRQVLSGSGGGLDASAEPDLRLWDVASGECLHVFRGPQGAIDAVCFSGNGQFAIAGGRDSMIRIWDIGDGTCRKNWPAHAAGVTALCRVGSRLLSAGRDGLVKLWDGGGRLQRTFTGHVGAVGTVTASRDGRLALSGGADHFLRLWDVDTGRCLYSWQVEYGAAKGALSADGTMAVSTGTPMRLWRLTAAGARPAPPVLCRVIGSEAASLAQGEYERELAAARLARQRGDYPAAAGRLRAARSQPGCQRRQQAMTEWTQLYGRLARRGLQGVWEGRRLGESEGTVSALCFTPDGKRLLSASETLSLWDVDSGLCLHRFAGHEKSVSAVCLSGDGRLALSGAWDGTIRLWEMDSGKCRRTIATGGTVSSVAMAADGRFLVSGRWDGNVHIWDPETGRCLREIVVARRRDEAVPFYNPLTGAQVRADWADGHGDTISLNALCLTPDARLLATADSRKQLLIWDVSTGELVHASTRHSEDVTDVCCSADGRRLLSGSWDKSLKVWDVATGRRVGHLEHGSTVQAVCLTADGRFAASGDHDHRVKIWDVERQVCLRTLEGHTQPIEAVAFSPDGRFLASAGQDGVVQLWVLDWDLDDTSGK